MVRRLSLLAVVILLLITGAAFAQDTSGQSYTVARGDTLDGIAAFYDVQTACLAESNGLTNPGKLEIGQTILIDFNCPRYDGLDFVTNPRDGGAQGAGGAAALGQGGGETAQTGVQPGPNDQTYTVQRGDTLDTIGQQFNVSAISLRLVNQLDENGTIFPGDTLVIPADAPPYGAFPALANPNAPATTQELGQGGGSAVGPGDEQYVVQPLDVLDLIGARFNKAPSCLAESNNLNNANRIFPGQSLLIPGNCPAYDGLALLTTSS